MAASGILGVEKATPPSAATSAPAALIVSERTADGTLTAALLPLQYSLMTDAGEPSCTIEPRSSSITFVQS